ncbi:hypothetical protein FQA39_LY17417 [Lamprigera yunnana]|nr:hypothetical protein FQA39_LY17417 [Lamprigera yunnana]
MSLRSVLFSITNIINKKLRVGVAEAPKYINKVKDELIVRKVTEANKWYTKVLGLDEVQYQQQRVILLQEKLLDVQEKRREIARNLMAIRKHSNELQEQLHKVKRQDDMQLFLDLMKAETELLKEEIETTDLFNVCDREEREIFTAFTNAVKDSHEKQRAQLEYTKYFGIILSILGSFLTFCYSTFRKRDLQNYINQRLSIENGGNVMPILLQLQENQKNITSLMHYINNEKSVVSIMEQNQKHLVKLLDNSNMLNTITKNHKELLFVLNHVSQQQAPVQQLTPQIQPQMSYDSDKINFKLIGAIALCGYIVLKIIVG